MGIKVTEVIVATCDICYKECGEHDGNITIKINSGDGRDVGPSVIWGQLFVNHPYGCTKGIVCKSCKVKWLQQHIDELKAQEKQND